MSFRIHRNSSAVPSWLDSLNFLLQVTQQSPGIPKHFPRFFAIFDQINLYIHALFFFLLMFAISWDALKLLSSKEALETVSIQQV